MSNLKISDASTRVAEQVESYLRTGSIPIRGVQRGPGVISWRDLVMPMRIYVERS